MCKKLLTQVTQYLTILMPITISIIWLIFYLHNFHFIALNMTNEHVCTSAQRLLTNYFFRFESLIGLLLYSSWSRLWLSTY
jgi:hypothetical protein